MTDRKYTIPPVDIFETKDKFILSLDMPGTTKEGIDIASDGDILTITGKAFEVDKEWKPIISEFELHDYKREFTIGNKVNRNNIDAKFDNGILTVELEKSEMIKPRKIEVKTA